MFFSCAVRADSGNTCVRGIPWLFETYRAVAGRPRASTPFRSSVLRARNTVRKTRSRAFSRISRQKASMSGAGILGSAPPNFFRRGQRRAARGLRKGMAGGAWFQRGDGALNRAALRRSGETAERQPGIETPRRRGSPASEGPAGGGAAARCTAGMRRKQFPSSHRPHRRRHPENPSIRDDGASNRPWHKRTTYWLAATTRLFVRSRGTPETLTDRSRNKGHASARPAAPGRPQHVVQNKSSRRRPQRRATRQTPPKEEAYTRAR